MSETTEMLDPETITGLLVLTLAQMEQEGVSPVPSAYISEGLRVACWMHTYAPEFLELMARWYADDGRSHEHDSEERSVRRWIELAEGIGRGEINPKKLRFDTAKPDNRPRPEGPFTT